MSENDNFPSGTSLKKNPRKKSLTALALVGLSSEAFGIACLLAYSLLHPLRMWLPLLAALSFAFGAALATSLLIGKRSRLPFLLWSRWVSSDQSVLKVLLGVLVMPPLVFGAPSAFVCFSVSDPASGEAGIEWVKRNVGRIFMAAMAANLILATALLRGHHLYTGAYIAASVAIFAISGPLFGLALEANVLRFFGKSSPGATPTFVLSCAVCLVLSFALLHYSVWLANSRSYAGMDGLQSATYFSVVTIATVGYGDISPVSHVARWLTMSEIAAGFLLLVVAFTVMSSIYIDRHSPRAGRPEASVPTREDAG